MTGNQDLKDVQSPRYQRANELRLAQKYSDAAHEGWDCCPCCCSICWPPDYETPGHDWPEYQD